MLLRLARKYTVFEPAGTELTDRGVTVADFDEDGDNLVDTDDVTAFVDCSTGPASTVAAFDALPVACKCFDTNDDWSIAQEDFAVLQRCLTVTGVPDPTCDD